MSTVAELQFLSCSFTVCIVCSFQCAKFFYVNSNCEGKYIRLIQKTSPEQCHITHVNSDSSLILNVQVREAFKYCICCWRRSRRGSYWVRGQSNEMKTSPNEVRGSDFPNQKNSSFSSSSCLPFNSYHLSDFKP